MTNKQYEIAVEKAYCAWMNRKTKYKCTIAFSDDMIALTVYDCKRDTSEITNLDVYEVYKCDEINKWIAKLTAIESILSGRTDPFCP